MADTPQTPPVPPVSFSTAQLMSMEQREFMLMVGKDGAGKSSAVVSLAKWVQDVLNPEANFWVIDTENKFPTALRSFGPDAPTNIKYFKCEIMNDVTNSWDVIAANRRRGDWLAVESMSRVWERAQDMGYRAISGFDKAAYMEKRRELGIKLGRAQMPVVIPKPDEFWNIVKGAHDGAFLDEISQATSLNTIMTTTIAKPPKDTGFIKENATRKEVRAEFGLDVGIDGAPRLPYFVETMVILDMAAGKGNCRVIRDNINASDENRKTFDIDDKKAWARSFWSNCR